MKRNRILLVAAILAAASCTPEAPLAPATPIEKETFAAALGINLSAMTKTNSGLYYQDAPAGNGTAAAANNDITVHYTGYFPSGTSFDSSIGRSPFKFTLGTGSVIKGWDEGLVGMKVGGTRKLVIPASLAYGESGHASIPPNTNLVFTVQLISIP
jgi:FKBP-type peptidyl-prolyl cis-trans isomerase